MNGIVPETNDLNDTPYQLRHAANNQITAEATKLAVLRTDKQSLMQQ